MDIITLAAAKKYTAETCNALGFVKGASAQIAKIEHKDGINTVTFEWTGYDGTKLTRDMIVYDGTPIYVWEPGNTYNYGDLVIYTAQFYRCIVENSDSTFDETKWNAIGTADGNYDIVANSALLPVRFTAADRKLYYSIADGFFWLWDGTKWAEQQPKSISKAYIDSLFD